MKQMLGTPENNATCPHALTPLTSRCSPLQYPANGFRVNIKENIPSSQPAVTNSNAVLIESDAQVS